MPQWKTVFPGFMGLVILVVLVSGGLPAATPAPLGFPTPTPAGPVPSGPPLSLTLTLIFTCCALGLVVGLIVVGFIVSMQNRNGGKPDKQA